jgi:alcohol dehydrogenase
MLPEYYEFYNPVKILSGYRAIDNLAHELSIITLKKPIIITDKGVENAGLINIVIKAFDDTDIVIGAIFDEVPIDSSLAVVNHIAQIFKEENCDCIIAVGGGSVIDTAKGVNIIVSNDGGDIKQFLGSESLRTSLKPLFVVPTTSGTGSEVTTAAIMRDTERDIKIPITSARLAPHAAILDLRMTLKLPPILTAATGMDALTHAVEAYTCLQKNPLSDAYAWMAVNMIGKYLLRVVDNPSDAEARLGMANASCMAGISFTNAMVGSVHAFAHATGGLYHVSHGVANGIFLPHVLEYNMPKIADMLAELLYPFAGDDVLQKTDKSERARVFIEEIRKMKQKLYETTKLPRTLKEAQVPPDDFTTLAQRTLDDGSMLMNPLDIPLEDAIEIIRKAYE